MKKQFSIFLLIFFISANINAEISGVSIRDLTQLYNNQISKVLVGNKLFGHIHQNDDKLGFKLFNTDKKVNFYKLIQS